MFLVIRRALTKYGGACLDQGEVDTGSRVPIRLFSDRIAAETLVTRLTAAARRTLNPFSVLNSVEKGLQERLAQLCLTLPCPEDRWPDDWREWWDLLQDEISDEQRNAVWSLFGAAPLFDVIPLEMSDD
jgi:hypothetical protein